MTIRFIDVGRDKATFERTIPDLNAFDMERQLRSGARVLSREISFGFDKDSISSGYVFAGMRAIGRWEVAAASLDSGGGL